MTIIQDLEALRLNDRELEEAIGRRRILTVCIIGIFMRKKLDERITETRRKKELAETAVRKYFSEMEDLLKRAEEVGETAVMTSEVSERFLSLRMDLRYLTTERASTAIALLGEEESERYHKVILECAKGYVEVGKAKAEREVEEVKNSGTYLVCPWKERLSNSLELLCEDFEHFESTEIQPDLVSQSQLKLAECRQTVLDYNRQFVDKRKKEYANLFSSRYLSLDEEQKEAVVTDDKYNLVVAGAGAGKTEVLTTRIAYLVKRKPDRVKADRILAIAYQKKDVEQIKSRLHERYNIESVEVKTFHKLGKEILQRSGDPHRPVINETRKHEIISELHKQRLPDPDYNKLLLQYAKCLSNQGDDTADARTDDTDYARQQTYVSIDNTRVKSKAEKEIMNFLLMNQLNGEPIEVEYEPEIGGFEPDFRLPKYDLFIEHWGVDVQGNVPEWFSQTTEEYTKNMERKKKWFEENNKLLVETCSYEYDSREPDKFIEVLRGRVIVALQGKYGSSFEFTPLTESELVKVVWGPDRNPIDDVVNLITVAKTYGLTPEKLVEKLGRDRYSPTQLAFGALAVKIFLDYRDFLMKTGSIDFEDMINEAITALDSRKDLCADYYDHILIDEYQDISEQRFKLIKKLLERNPACKLFCVGDDWQSIMSFAGSNLNFFVNFDKYFEKPAVTKISTNYRSTKTIVDAGAHMIKMNGDSQIPKNALSSKVEERSIRVFRSPHKRKYRTQYYEQTTEDCLDRINQHIKNGYQPQDILVLSRFIRTRGHKAYRYQQIIKTLLNKAEEKGLATSFNADTQDKIRILSVHKSKGLEAKAVFLLNVINDTWGFPSQMEEQSLYAPARENYPEQDPKQEERRLFYVALTRAKDDLTIYTWEPSKSEFLKEIEGYTKEERLSY